MRAYISAQTQINIRVQTQNHTCTYQCSDSEPVSAQTQNHACIYIANENHNINSSGKNIESFVCNFVCNWISEQTAVTFSYAFILLKKLWTRPIQAWLCVQLRTYPEPMVSKLLCTFESFGQLPRVSNYTRMLLMSWKYMSQEIFWTQLQEFRQQVAICCKALEFRQQTAICWNNLDLPTRTAWLSEWPHCMTQQHTDLLTDCQSLCHPCTCKLPPPMPSFMIAFFPIILHINTFRELPVSCTLLMSCYMRSLCEFPAICECTCTQC